MRPLAPGPAARCALLLALAGTGAGAGAPEPGPGAPTARIEAGLLTLRSDGAPLVEVLEVLGAAGGFAVHTRGDLSAPVVARITGLPLDDALRRLAGEAALVMVYAPLDAAPAGPRRLLEVRVYGGVKGDPVTVRMSLDRPAAASREGTAAQEPPPLPPEFEALDRPARLARLRALVGRDDAAAAARLGQVLARDPDPEVRALAIDLLRSMDGEPAVFALEDGLGDPDDALRARVVEALASSDAERAAVSLGQVLFSEPQAAIRAAAVEGLSAQGTEAARQLVEAATRDRDPLVREAAEFALAAWRGGNQP